MASVNEVKKMIGRAVAGSGFLDDYASTGISSDGKLYIQLNGQVFEVDVKTVDQFDAIENQDEAIDAAQNFMKTHPQIFEKAVRTPKGQ